MWFRQWKRYAGLDHNAKTRVRLTKNIRTELLIVSIDIREAFDSLRRDALTYMLGQALKEEHPDSVQYMTELYTEQFLTLRRGDNIRRVPTGVGVRQGDPASPALYNAAVGLVLTQAEKEWRSEETRVRLQKRTNHPPLTYLGICRRYILVGNVGQFNVIHATRYRPPPARIGLSHPPWKVGTHLVKITGGVHHLPYPPPG